MEKGPKISNHTPESTDDGTGDIRPVERVNTQRQWERRRQRIRVLWHLSWRLLITLALCAITAGVLVAYEHKYIIEDNQKNTFNALLTGLSIGIGLNVAAGLIQIAQYARWYLLSRKPLHMEQFEHVFQCDSQTSTLKLMISKYSSIWTRLACLAWLLFNVGIQIVIALLGLSYSLGIPADAGSYNIASKIGNASVAVLNPITDYQTYTTGATVPIARQQSQANIFGQQIANFQQEPASGSAFGGASDATYYGPADVGPTSWWHFFTDQSTTISQALPSSNVISNRVVKSTAICEEWKVLNQSYTDSSAIVFIQNTYNTYNVSFAAAVDIGDTTYLSFVDEASIPTPRSAQVIAIVSAFHPRAFVCNNTLSRVGDYNPNTQGWIDEYPAGAVPDELQIPDEQARILAGAIGWPLNPTGDFAGSVTYSNSSYLAIGPNSTASGVAVYASSQFTIAAITAMDSSGPRTVVPQIITPDGGLTLVVKWSFAASILGVIPFVHFLLIIVVLWMGHKTIMRDNSPYATAMLFRPVLDHITHGGAMLDSREIARLRGEKDPHLVYTFDHDEEGVAVLKAKHVPKGGYEYRKFNDGAYM